MGFTDSLEQAFSGETNIVQAARQVARLRETLLVDMGTKFKILIQQKGVTDQGLSGLSLLPEATS